MYHHILVPTDGSSIAQAAPKKVAAQARALKVPCEKVLLTSGEPWAGIVDAERLFLGSVATEVLTHSRTPVLVCRGT